MKNQIILIYDVSYKPFREKSLHIIYNEGDEFLRHYGGTKYLLLFGSEKYDAIYDRIRYLIVLKSSIAFMFFLIFS